ncbi:hypothetical protein [Novosphingobium humi]|uniref:DUF3618 domain-containing protein n=1 Tax=Novosphingobium humi TaxID=2282397 RepID=A0ABY7TVY9_9SPHN|nr:hypothetical protein [Novosphingobium humi]WCT76781.1 hypothetical protein PQ457_12715 [Novosphingobium humi]WJS99698.1 hypothetical protein NYQ05_06015 [Novosphingobium humi]
MSAPKISGLIRQNGQSLVRKAVDTIIVQDKAGNQQRVSLPRKIAGFALTKLATRSVPGAILVGGVLLAKHLHDRKQERKKDAAEEGE